jgi:molecular chaperone DnaJ
VGKKNMNTQRDYYEILGIAKSSSMDEIKKAYRQLVMQFHPDRVSSEKKKEAEAKFKEISEAYAVLSDPQKKQLYDQYGHAGVDSRYSQEDIFRNADFSDIFRSAGRGGSGFESIFEDLFGESFDIFGSGRSSRSSRRQGEDVNLELSITLEEAAFGGEKEISYYRYENCSSCSGSGAVPGSGKETCSTCRGRGAVASSMGFISFSQSCPTCRGHGTIIKQRCSKCSGEGRIKERKTVKVTIPQGVDTGSILRLRAEGNFAGSANGDLYLHIAVKPHDLFIRDGNDLRSKINISVFQAVLGAEIEVPTLGGQVKMKIPAGTQPGSVFRLQGKGVAGLKTKRLGDQFVEVSVEIPTRLSGKEKTMFAEIAKARKESFVV